MDLKDYYRVSIIKLERERQLRSKASLRMPERERWVWIEVGGETDRQRIIANLGHLPKSITRELQTVCEKSPQALRKTTTSVSGNIGV